MPAANAGGCHGHSRFGRYASRAWVRQTGQISACRFGVENDRGRDLAGLARHHGFLQHRGIVCAPCLRQKPPVRQASPGSAYAWHCRHQPEHYHSYLIHEIGCRAGAGVCACGQQRSRPDFAGDVMSSHRLARLSRPAPWNSCACHRMGFPGSPCRRAHLPIWLASRSGPATIAHPRHCAFFSADVSCPSYGHAPRQTDFRLLEVCSRHDPLPRTAGS